VRVVTESGEEWDPSGKDFRVKADWARSGASGATPRKRGGKGKNGDRGAAAFELSLDLPPVEVLPCHACTTHCTYFTSCRLHLTFLSLRSRKSSRNHPLCTT
jgi:hypothetical protein